MNIHCKEVEVTETVLGKGAFGEVRVARWRNIEVAYKRIHAHLEDDPSLRGGEEDELRAEVDLLSRLRHPNLVLFLGTCIDAATNKTALVTELLPSSLYDLLETQRAALSLPDILDIALDVANGLDYLHAHEPTIVHRDVSAKNILLGGGRAKIADLGQAKLFRASTLSRQTGMPGAMAYAAPEVLTGKYSAKIDVFSFGVLLCQMCTGEYPRIDRREEQIESALQRYPMLADVLSRCVSYVPDERPSAAQLCASLSALRDNDRFYPVHRRSSPEKDTGVLALHWMHAEIDSRCALVQLKLEQCEKLLAAEQRRAESETRKTDDVLAQLRESRERILALETQLAEEQTRAQFEQQEKERHAQAADDMKQQLGIVSDELQRCAQRQRSLEAQLASKSLDLQTAQAQLHEQRGVVERQRVILGDLQESDAEQTRKQTVLQRQLEMQVDYARDLESRLDQTLSRWKQEQETFHREQLNVKKLTAQLSAVISAKEEAERELQLCESRLRLYEGMPVPTEIKARFEEMERNIDVLKTNHSLLLQEKEQLVQENQTLQSSLADIERHKLELEDTLRGRESIIAMRDLEVSKWREEAERLEKEKNERISKLESAQQERDVLEGSLKKLLRTLDELRVELATEKNKHMMLTEKMKHFQDTLRNNSHSDEALRLLVVESEESERKEDVNTAAMEAENTDSNERSTDIAVKHLIERTARQSGAKGLIDLLLTHSHDERVLWRALRSLRELVLRNDEDRQQCIASNPQQWLVSMLPDNLQNSTIQGQVARLLGTLSFGNDTFRRKAGERNVMAYLADTLRVHSEDETVVLHVATAITNLTHGSKENRSRFEESGGVPFLIEAMYRNAQSAKVQRQCCWAMLTLSGSDDVASSISSHNGDVAIIGAMSAHSLDSGVQQYGCWALSNLALTSDDIVQKLKDLGFIELCQIAIENHSEDVEVLRQAKNALGVFAPHLHESALNKVLKSPKDTTTLTNKPTMKKKTNSATATMLANSPYLPSVKR